MRVHLTALTLFSFFFFFFLCKMSISGNVFGWENRKFPLFTQFCLQIYSKPLFHSWDNTKWQVGKTKMLAKTPPFFIRNKKFYQIEEVQRMRDPYFLSFNSSSDFNLFVYGTICSLKYQRGSNVCKCINEKKKIPTTFLFSLLAFYHFHRPNSNSF